MRIAAKWRDRRRAVQRRRELLAPEVRSDAFLVGASAMALVFLSILMVFNTSYFYAQERFGDPYLFSRTQLVAAALGGIAGLVASKIPLRVYRALAYPSLAFSAAALFLVLDPSIGSVGGGARRWLEAGPFRFQPSELAKLAVILALAHLLAKKGPSIAKFQTGFLPVLVLVGPVAVLIALEPDFGTAVLAGGVAFLLLVANGARWTHLLGTASLALPLAGWVAVSADYRWQRITSFLNPWLDARDTGFQLTQSLIAFGAGGPWGVGIGAGQQKMFYLPGAHTDFIFSVIGEELGLLGTVTVLALFTAFAVGGFRIASAQRDPFAANVALGITTVVLLQASINMGVAVGMLPTKGIALPFLSYGGSALVTNLAMVGVLLGVARGSR